MASSEKWDVAIIGSGVGALMAGALLAKRSGQRVLVLEKHYKVGGCTHSFKRKKNFVFDVGVHYVSNASENSVLRNLLNELTDRRLKWKPLPDRLDHVHLPDGDYAIPSDWVDSLEYLRGLFPNEARSLRAFYREAKRISDAFVAWQNLELEPRPIQALKRAAFRLTHPNMFKTIQEVLDAYFTNPRLKLLLTARWPGLGLRTEHCSFGYFAGDMTHFADGGWYPAGGGERIAEELKKTIEDHGGEVRTSVKVDQILVTNGRATGLRAAEKLISAETIVSGAGAWATYRHLLNEADSPYFTAVNKPLHLISYVMVFITLNEPPRALGIDAANHWIYAADDCPPFFPHDPELRFIDSLWVGSPSLKRGSDAHTLEFALLAPTETVAKWRGTAWRRRPEGYEAFKQKLYHACLEIAESRFPGLGKAISYWEVSTPLTVEHFVTESAGGLGIPATPERLYYPWARSTTPIKGLYLTGSDVFAWGISGALIGGWKAFRLIEAPTRNQSRAVTNVTSAPAR